MRPTAVAVILTIAIVAAGILHFSLNQYTRSNITAGCEPISSTGLVDPNETVAIWENHTVDPVLALVDTLSPQQKKVLGTTTADDKWIEVTLSQQKLVAWEGTNKFLESPISSGLWNSTPTGEYRIWYKIRSTKMEGGIKGTSSYYYLPNVPYDMFFSGSYGIHGTYWHNSFGTPRSHGCVNTPTPVAEKLFYWTNPQIPAGKTSVKSSSDNPGTRVVIHE